MTYIDHVGPTDRWPVAVSDGVLLACVDCQQVPSFDYQVTDAFWREHVRDEGRLGVVCLPCLGLRCNGVGLAEALRFVQWVGPGVTVELLPSRAWTYAPRHLTSSLLVIAGQIPAEALRPGDDWPELHGSFAEMIEKLRETAA